MDILVGPERTRVGGGVQLAMPALGYNSNTLGSAPTLRAAREAVDRLVATQHAGAPATVELWCVKWGLEAWVFRCTVTTPYGTAVYAVNVARDLRTAANAVQHAALALRRDRQRLGDTVVPVVEQYLVPVAPCERLCPVVATEWAQDWRGDDLHELHVYPAKGLTVYCWPAQTETTDAPLSLEASTRLWHQLLRDTVRATEHLTSTVWSLDCTGFAAGDYVATLDGAWVRRVWARRRRVVGGSWVPLAAALLTRTRDSTGAVYLDQPHAALEAVDAPAAARTLLGRLVRRAVGRQYVAQAILGEVDAGALAVLERAQGVLP
jgi:hypothetical protein